MPIATKGRTSVHPLLKMHERLGAAWTNPAEPDLLVRGVLDPDAKGTDQDHVLIALLVAINHGHPQREPG